MTVRLRNNVVVHDMDFSEIADGALAVYAGAGEGPPSVYLTGIEVYNCSFTNCSADHGTWSAGALHIGQLDGALIHNNVIRENQGYGIKYIDYGWYKGVKVYDNDIEVPIHDPAWGSDICIEMWNMEGETEVYGNTCNTWLSTSPGRILGKEFSCAVHDNRIIVPEGAAESEAIEVIMSGHGWSEKALVYGNYIDNSSYGVALWGGVDISDVKIYRNVFRSNNTGWAHAGVLIKTDGSGTYNGVSVDNNVFDECTNAVFIIGGGGNIPTLDFRNNIIMNCGNAIAIQDAQTDIDSRNNCVWQSGATPGSSNIESDPELNLKGDRADPYYRPLSATSAVVDAGIDVGLPYIGTAPDIGAFEFEGDVTTHVAIPARTSSNRITKARKALFLFNGKMVDWGKVPTYRSAGSCVDSENEGILINIDRGQKHLR